MGSKRDGAFSVQPRGAKRVRRYVLAQLRDLRILVREFGLSIVAFAAVLLIGGTLINAYYHDSAEPMTFGRAVYSTFNMIFFQPQLKYPDAWQLEILFYVVPLLGLGVIVEGFVRFGHLVVNKKLRGEEWQRIVASTYSDHVVLCGLGHVGYRVAEQLFEMGQDMVIIAHESKFIERVKRAGIPVVVGDARDESLLDAANVRQARAIIIATDDDLANLDIVTTARERNPGIRTLVRLFDAELGRKMQKALGIDMAFSTSQLTAPAVALGAMSRSILHSFYVGEELLSMAELAVSSSCKYVDRPLEELEREERITVVVHRSREGTHVHPEAGDLLRGGDGILFLADLKTIERLQGCGFLAQESATLGTSMGMHSALLAGVPK
jgi:Trk K+ transport system NAD-binding subunit